MYNKYKVHSIYSLKHMLQYDCQLVVVKKHMI